MRKIAIRFTRVTKKYKLYKNDRQRFLAIFFKGIKCREKYANRNVSFKIRRGESVAIFGRNGAGKSTMLKMITGVIFPTKGKLVIKGRVSALLELTAGFDGEFTGRENIYIKGHILGLNDKQIKEVESDIVSFAELEDYIDQPVRTYSSGMKARLGFAINSNIKPDILVIDEALSVGDFSFKKKCDEKIKELVKEEHVTVLLVTHNASSARKLCDRGIVLQKGKLVFDGDIDKAISVYHNKPVQ